MVETSTYTFAVLTVSTKGAAGKRQDTSGEALKHILTAAGFIDTDYAVVPDDAETISATLRRWIDEQKIDLVVTTGGTGVSPSDVTPEATAPLLQRQLPGMAEAMRAKSLSITPHAMLSRGLAGIRETSLIINLPGSEKAARENIETILSAIPHALYKIKGGSADCGAPTHR